MDFNLKQWRNESEQKEEEDEEIPKSPSLKLPKLLRNSHPHQHQHSSSALPLFVPEPLSAYSSEHSTKFPRMGSYFSLAQWQELELQALIFRHMIAGATVPLELLHLVKKSLIMSSPPSYYLSHPHYSPYQPALVQSGYWGKGAMDPEPGRCRRTDGKKWRCSRDVVAGQKYCERHMHRGRNRSRKPVEVPTSTTTTYGGGGAGEPLKSITTTTTTTTQGMATGGGVPHFTLSGPSPSMDLLHFNRRPSDIIETKGPFEGRNDSQSDGTRTLRRFFDDWPRSLNETDSETNLSISMPGNPSSDFSLKLGTSNGDESSAQVMSGERERPRLNWGATWETNPMAPMGGPLAEALRSSTAQSSPTSVLHRLPRGLVSEASYVSS
ncbi:hypothetical protein RD792_012040 [Penstemon davidsonii]|uniref:Growth-regulating factor n=1 Tax=Penstemon davidsonii TaxID=160366 RepID=A0ABR0CVQ6_9LAMI|nr:hypothetical protein RD792_012040 [Penstemon davidsonii]